MAVLSLPVCDTDLAPDFPFRPGAGNVAKLEETVEEPFLLRFGVLPKGFPRSHVHSDYSAVRMILGDFPLRLAYPFFNKDKEIAPALFYTR